MKPRIKFRRKNSPAFKTGERWVSCSGGFSCWIDKVETFGEGKFDGRVFYRYSDGHKSDKDVWPFQVRYMHNQDAK